MLVKMKWGIHPKYRKDQTAGKPIEQLALPKKVTIPVRQHIGAPCIPLVKKGDIVKKGALIAANEEARLTSRIHASISGTVTNISNRPHPTAGQCLSIEITGDGLDEWDEGVLQTRDWQAMEPAALLDCVKDAGIVGMGGAAFPTYVKLSPPPGAKIDTLIINAAECEPFLTVDHRVMLEQTEKLMTGIRIIRRILGISQVLIGIESNKPDAVAILRAAAGNDTIKVVTLPTRYPQGAEKMLIACLLGREVPSGGLPMDVGVVVQNSGTCVAVCEAVTEGRPLIERALTVAGGAVKEPKNLRVRVGTRFADVIAACGGFCTAPQKILMGGPMMGMAQYTLDVPVIKGTSGILALTAQDTHTGGESACIRCGRCVNNCPMGLNPSMLSILGEKKLFEEAKESYHLLDCIECGCCTYGCPSKRNIVHYIKLSKKYNADLAAAKKAAVTAK